MYAFSFYICSSEKLRMAKKKESISGNYESEFAIIGIACHDFDYRVIHFLNKVSNFNFIRYDDFLIPTKGEENDEGFPFYFFNDSENYTSFHFIANRSADGILIKEWKQMDYLLVIFGSVHSLNIKSMIHEIRKLPIVLAATEMPRNYKIGVENLVLDIELHIIEIQRKEKEKERLAKNKLKNIR